MKLINGSWFSLFSNFEEESGLEYFYFVIKLTVRLLLSALSLRLLTVENTVANWKRSFAVFQEEHGQNWRSWPTKYQQLAGNLLYSEECKYCRTVLQESLQAIEILKAWINQ